jgi:hypothetical protein
LERFLGNLVFWRKIQRRGAHVSPLKIGSRGEVFVFGGILGFCADLRREFVWGGLRFSVFEGGGAWDHVGGEEGGHYVCVFGGICCGVVLGFCGWRPKG